MNFKQALEEMKNGNKVKLPSWGGYWCWDDTKQTIMMHCRPKDADKGQGPILDIRETQRVEYTLSNILSDEWVIADNENCTLLGGTPTFNFGEAIKYLKRGFKVCRKGWNGKAQYIELSSNISYELPKENITNCEHERIENKSIDFIGASDSRNGWLVSADILADDWMFYND